MQQDGRREGEAMPGRRAARVTTSRLPQGPGRCTSGGSTRWGTSRRSVVWCGGHGVDRVGHGW